MSTVPPADFGLDFPVRKSVHAAQRGPLVPLAVSPRIDCARAVAQRRAGRRRALDQNEQITCWRCENDIGIATSMAVRVILAPRRTPLGRLVPGTEGWICAYCLKRGKVTSLSRY